MLNTRSIIISEAEAEQLQTSAIEQRHSEVLAPFISEESSRLIPRNQNKIVAEKTRDMFLSGMMCE
jgi:hypothetical protein